MRMHKTRIVFLAVQFAMTLGFCSCARESEERLSPMVVPADEAIPEERRQLDEAITKIEAYTAELGRPQSFRSVPVVLTTDKVTYTDRFAACVRRGGEGQFILVNRLVLERESQYAEVGIESTLFRVLLHEIGHCYFHREHDDARIFSEGNHIELTEEKTAGKSRKLRYVALDESIMATEGLTMPIALEKYYVAELLGIARAHSLGALAEYAPLKYVKSRRKINGRP